MRSPDIPQDWTIHCNPLSIVCFPDFTPAFFLWQLQRKQHHWKCSRSPDFLLPACRFYSNYDGQPFYYLWYIDTKTEMHCFEWKNKNKTHKKRSFEIVKLFTFLGLQCYLFSSLKINLSVPTWNRRHAKLAIHHKENAMESLIIPDFKEKQYLLKKTDLAQKTQIGKKLIKF